MNIRFDFKKVQIIARRLVTLLAILFLCAPISLLNADSTTEPQTTLHKTITPISGQDDKYELSLDITSKLGTETQTDPLDVVLVADLSGSMQNQDVQSFDGRTISRIDALKNTLRGTNGRKGLIDTILSNSNNRLSMVGFGGKIDNKKVDQYWDGHKWRLFRPYWPYERMTKYYDGVSPWDDANTILGWSNNARDAKNAVYNMSIASGNSIGTESGIGTGTNIGAGLTLANQLMGSARSNAKKVVILLSDGFANMVYDANGYTIYNYNNEDPNIETAPQWFWDRLNNNLNSLSYSLAPTLDGFYSIKFRYSNNVDSITSLQYYMRQHNASIPNEIFSANDEDQLRDSFKDITDKILPLGIHHVSIKDVLSKYVQLLPNGSSEFRVVKEKDGSSEILTENQVTFDTKTTSEGLVEVTAKFSPNYSLEDGARYVLKFTVTSSQEALDAIAGDKKLEAGDAEGSDVNKLYSNKGASVTYSYGIGNSQTKTKEYSDNPTFKPSDPLTVPVEVEWQGVTGARTVITADQPSNVELKLVQKNKNGGPDNQDYRKTNVNVSKNVSNETRNFEKVAKGYQYDLIAPDVPAFTKEIKNVGTETKPSFKVIYKQLPSLTIKKVLEAENNLNKEFRIKVKLTSPDSKPLNGTFGDITVVNGEAEIRVEKRKRWKGILSYLPRGTHYKVEEEAASTNGYHVTYENQEGDLNKDETSIVTNHKLPSLSVTKKVTGVFANLLKSFKITINIRDAQNSPLNGTYTATVNNKRTPLQFTNGRVSIDLNKDQTIKIDGLPLNSHYTVEEESNSSSGYQVSYENQEGKLDGDKSATVTNNKNSVPETGVDFLSSTLMLGIILPLGGIFFTILLGYLVVHRRK
ncbi:von Willebrand factor type A domain protein [Streptococcus oralis]|uniref:von Willebrand factor type A domain protein n=1 Tax=Streptococcus oralis TaxID=1303 RepID=A0A3R9MX33_STROR|nr:PI-2 pilus tip adhesin PitA [Streptococcus oralis]RSK18435.1 von Willebrand factor type A domain protein [Streptococcus oralis]